MATVIPLSDFADIRATAASTTNGAPDLGVGTNSGKLYPLGFIGLLGAVDEDRDFAFVTSAGVLSGDYTRKTDPDYDSTEVAVEQKAGEGAFELIYVANASGSTIERGQNCKMDVSEGSFYVEQAGAVNADEVIGIALWDIPDGQSTWILRVGVGEVDIAAGAESAGQSLVPAASGESDAQAAVTDSTHAQLIEASAGGVLSRAKVRCRG